MSVPWLPFSSPRSVAVLLSERCLSHQTSNDASCTEWSQARALPEALRWRESTRYLVRMQRSDNRDHIWAALTRGSPFRLVARGLAVAVVFAASGTLARHTDGRIADCVLAQPLRPRQCQCFRAVQGADSFACEQITMDSPPIATAAMGLANFWVARNSNWYVALSTKSGPSSRTAVWSKVSDPFACYHQRQCDGWVNPTST